MPNTNQHKINLAINAARRNLRDQQGYPWNVALTPYRAEYRERMYYRGEEYVTTIEVDFESATVDDIENLPSDAGADKSYAIRHYAYTIEVDDLDNPVDIPIVVYAAIAYYYTEEEKALLKDMGKVEEVEETYTSTRSYLRCG